MGARVLIVGAGAIGGVTAAQLVRAGQQVTVLDANREHALRLNSPGLAIDEGGTTSVVVIDAVSEASDLIGRFDFAFTMLKAPFIEAALTPLVEMDLVDTYVSFGNGLVQQRVESVVGPERLLIGIVEWGATNLGVGHVAKTTTAPFVIGEIDGSISPRLIKLGETLANAGEVRISENIFGQVWSKLLLNSTFSGLGAVAGMVYSDVVAQPGGVDLALAVWAEGYAVAMASGVVLDDVAGVHPKRLFITNPGDRQVALEALKELMLRLGPTKASMLQDLERQARTEIDVINGGVVSQAKKVGLPAPLNQGIVDIVRECERQERQPGPNNLIDLRSLLKQ